jgi:hypothetical protein
MCIWGICVQILEDLFHTPNTQAIIDSFKVLLSFCTHHDYNVARSALDSLSCISLNYKNVADLDHGMVETVTETLCQNIIKSIVDSQVNRGFAVKEQVVADHFYCLLDWIMYAHPDYLFDKVSLASKLFEAIELGLIGQKSTTSLPNSSSSSNVTVPSPSDRDSKSRDKSKDKKKRMSVREPEKNDKKEEDTSDSRLNPTHGSAVICEAAEILWMHLLSFLQNFPCKEGIDIHSSLVTETDDHLEQDPSTTFYVFNDSLIVSVIQVPHPSGGVAARIILRDQTGKYAWDSLLTYDNPKEKNIEQPVPLFRDSNVPEVYVPVPDPELSKLPKYQRDYRIRPKYVGDQNCSITDQLDQLLEL